MTEECLLEQERLLMASKEELEAIWKPSPPSKEMRRALYRLGLAKSKVKKLSILDAQRYIQCLLIAHNTNKIST